MPWQNWSSIAIESIRSGIVLTEHTYYQSSLSRFYYAAFQAATAVLLYLGLKPPADRQSWRHDQTPELLRNELNRRRLLSSRQCNRLKSNLELLYKLRIVADYVASDPVGPDDARLARLESGTAVKMLQKILP